jgi:hypothetical protein
VMWVMTTVVDPLVSIRDAIFLDPLSKLLCLKKDSSAQLSFSDWFT